MIDFLTDLRAATKHVHGHLETVPYHRALTSGELPKVSAIGYLHTLATLHATLESALRSLKPSELSELFESCEPKLPALLADLRKINEQEGALTPSIPQAAAASYSFSNSLTARSDDPFYLVGVLYVFEGSQNGGALLKKLYAQAIGVQEDELSYFGFYGHQTRLKWRSFTEKLSALQLSNEQRASAIAGASDTFSSIEKILKELYPYNDSDLVFHVSALNPEAGDHQIPQDPKELELAIKVGNWVWGNYDYLEKRFGERGQRFTTSDSCWLVSLSKLPLETTTQNLKWIRSILASRGIPSVLLESHLRQLQREMKTQGFDDFAASHYDEFLSTLASERTSSFNAEMIASVISEFDCALNSSPGEKVKNAAELIVSAWLDRKAGASDALASVQKWLCDKKAFSPDWANSVEQLIGTLDAIEVRV